MIFFLYYKLTESFKLHINIYKMSSFKRKIEEQQLYEVAKGKVRLGLCCINNTLRNPVKEIGQKKTPNPIFNSRTTTRKCFNIEYVKDLAIQNIKDIIPILEWNQAHGIRHFRLTSNLFPHYTDTNTESYSMDFAKNILREAGNYANNLGHRITTHPGQYTQPASIHQNVREKSLEDLVMHAEIFDAMGIDDNGILCIHGGGTYGKDKETAIRRWCDHFEDLPRKVKNHFLLKIVLIFLNNAIYLLYLILTIIIVGVIIILTMINILLMILCLKL
jgi:UV DNA damage endonuclease